MSLLPSTDILTLVMRSDSEADKAIANKLIKTAAVIDTVTAGHGNFGPVNH